MTLPAVERPVIHTQIQRCKEKKTEEGKERGEERN